MPKTPIIFLLGSAAAAAALAGCSSGSTASSATATGASAASSAAATGAAATASGSAAGSASAASASATCPVSVSDAWVKAADSGMTAAFGVVRNGSGAAVTITAASSPASTMTQLHKTTVSDGTATMSEVPDFVVPAGGELTLQPGGDHIMFMSIPQPVTAGQDVPITLTCAGGGTAEFVAQARTFAGASESYQAGM